MAAPFVPVPFPVDWNRVIRNTSKRASPVYTDLPSTNCEPPCLGRGGGLDSAGVGVGWTICDGTWSSKLLQGENSRRKRSMAPILLGYEILEERAKFTVYKILVTGRHGDSWVIFRRYTDFCRLRDKLKVLFPSFRPALPPKRRLKDNYDDEFIEKRRVGLQTFLQDLMSHRHVFTSETVRHFLSLADLSGPFDSLEESRAFCETLQETNLRLQRELLEKEREIERLRKTLEDSKNHINLLLKKVQSPSLASESSKDSS